MGDGISHGHVSIVNFVSRKKDGVNISNQHVSVASHLTRYQHIFAFMSDLLAEAVGQSFGKPKNSIISKHIVERGKPANSASSFVPAVKDSFP